MNLRPGLSMVDSPVTSRTKVFSTRFGTKEFSLMVLLKRSQTYLNLLITRMENLTKQVLTLGWKGGLRRRKKG